MTAAEIKSNIDSQIVNETVDYGITPAEVGNNMKDTVDFTTQETAALDAKKVDKVTGKSLVSDTEIAKLAAYSPGAAEYIANKSTDVNADGTSDVKYPSVKAVKTYVDNSAIVKVKKIRLTQTEVLNLGNVPKLLLSSTDPLKELIPINFLLRRYEPGTAYSLTNLAVVGNYGALNQMQPDILNSTSQLVIGTLNDYGYVLQDKQFTPVDYFLIANGTTPTGGTGGFDVYLTYLEITF